MNEHLKINQAGVDLIKTAEGLHKKCGERHGETIVTTYLCPSDVLTIGYGTTGSKVRQGMVITESEAEDLLREDIEHFEAAVKKLVKVELNENEFSALVSFAYNCGEGALGSSTALKRLNTGDREGCVEALQWWNKGAHGVLPGLVKRRRLEGNLFLSKAISKKDNDELEQLPMSQKVKSSTATWIEIFPPEQPIDKPIIAAWKGSDEKPIDVLESNSTKELIKFLKFYGSSAKTFLIAPLTKKAPEVTTPRQEKPDSQETDVTSTDDIQSKIKNFPDQIKQAIQRQLDRSRQYVKGSQINLNTKTKFFSQRDNYTMPHRTCNSSSNAMYLDWLLRATGTSDGLKTDDEYLRTVLKYGDTIYHNAQTSAIKEYGFNTKWMTDEDLLFIEALVDCGFPVVVNILHRGTESAPRGGHIIMLIGRKQGKWIAHDPYGTLESNYSNTNGAYSRITESEFANRWQGGYRILA
ncbi:MAG: glycoside hydrolase family protein [Symploca sp. SIO2E6]|nr:glycoside hydrolase family protein [Symploca sp. SIO2E6]